MPRRATTESCGRPTLPWWTAPRAAGTTASWLRNPRGVSLRAAGRATHDPPALADIKTRGGRPEPARPSGRARSREPVTSSSSQPSSSCPSSSQPSSWPCENHLLEMNGLLVGSPSTSLATNCSRCASFVALLATHSRVRRSKNRHSRLRATRAPRRRCESFMCLRTRRLSRSLHARRSPTSSTMALWRTTPTVNKLARYA